MREVVHTKERFRRVLLLLIFSRFFSAGICERFEFILLCFVILFCFAVNRYKFGLIGSYFLDRHCTMAIEAYCCK